MSFRIVGSSGGISDPVAINMPASGTINPGIAVDLLRTSSGVGPSTNSSTGTMVFGVGLDYAQGTSDTFVRVVPFTADQLWEVDCANATVTAQVGIRHALSATRGFIHNTSSDVASNSGVFLALSASSLTTGSGKLIGKFVSNIVPVGQNQTTFN